MSATIVVDGYTFTVTVAKAPTAAGVQAGRIADLLEPLGPNTFSSATPDPNLWGAFPADYSPPSVIAAMNYITNNSGLTLQLREYHYAGRESIQGPWLKQVTAATGSKAIMCVGANGSLNDVASLLALAADPANNISSVEGINEPNWDVGSGVIPPATTLAIQTALGASSVGPSIVVGDPPEGWITGLNGYFSSTDLAQLKIAMANLHFYPQRAPDLDGGTNRGGVFDSMVAGLKLAYGAKPLLITEWHPTLFNADGQSANDALAAYLAPIMLLSAYRLGVKGMFWFALFDFESSGYRCGLFPRSGAVNPRPVANALRALFTLTGDHGATKRTFTPGRFNYRISNLPPPVNAASPHSGGQHALFQASDGRFFIPLWNSQLMPGGATVPVPIDFASPVAGVKEFNITSGSLVPVQSHSATSGLVSQLDASVRLLVIAP